LQNLIATLQEQKSHPGEKSRSATPSTIESDVASVEGMLATYLTLGQTVLGCLALKPCSGQMCIPVRTKGYRSLLAVITSI